MSRGHYNSFRQPQCKQKLALAAFYRTNPDDFYHRLRGKESNQPTVYDDMCRESFKNWKRFRKHQYK